MRALLDHLEDLGTNVQSHCKRLTARHYPALPVNVLPSNVAQIQKLLGHVQNAMCYVLGDISI